MESSTRSIKSASDLLKFFSFSHSLRSAPGPTTQTDLQKKSCLMALSALAASFSTAVLVEQCECSAVGFHSAPFERLNLHSVCRCVGVQILRQTNHLRHRVDLPTCGGGLVGFWPLTLHQPQQEWSLSLSRSPSQSQSVVVPDVGSNGF